MPRWLQSGLRRDLCVCLLAGPQRSGAIKTALERRYDGRIRPKTFHGALEALVDSGHLERRVDGVQERYALTDAGRAAVEDHYEWVERQLATDE